ncbi:UNVERIFIED_CONTAM: hypothetical protein FKN15_027661 [Acipenser sinensis]
MCTETEGKWKQFFKKRSIGVLAYVMLTGMSPFLGEDKQETFLNISKINVSYSEEEFEGISKSAIDFMKALLIKEPVDRATAEDCLQHQWLQQEQAEASEAASPYESSPEEASPVSSPEEPEAQTQVKEEFIVMAAYTLGQCRQSEKENITSDQKAISKRFKFEEPFSSL